MEALVVRNDEAVGSLPTSSTIPFNDLPTYSDCFTLVFS
jgi:hypothetical protein